MKTCSVCKQEKEVTQFNRRSASKDGLQGYCRECSRKACRRQDLKRRYGITVEQFDSLLEEQGGGCAICGTTEPVGRGNTFHVDHCHDGRHVRGLLCHSCNTAIGLMQDNPERLIEAAAYIARHDRKED